MRYSEITHIIAAIIILTAVAGFAFAIKNQWENVLLVLIFAVIILFVNILAKKFMAYLVDSDVEHELWKWSRFGIKPWMHLPKPIPMGIIAPLFLSVISLGSVRFMAPLTYEARALTHRAARRFGFFSYANLSDFHNGLIGAAGILAVLVLSLVAYIIPLSSSFNLQLLAQLSAYFAFSNILPLSNLDGTQILFGSKVLYFTLAIITLIFTILSFLIAIKVI